MSDLQTWDRQRVELRVASGSMHPLVQSALGELQVMVALAHAEEVEAELVRHERLLDMLSMGLADYPQIVVQLCLLTREVLTKNDANAIAALRNFIDVAL